jgi:hypothetical protein
MKILQLSNFLKLFESHDINFTEFMRKAKVRTSAGLVPLKEYVQRRDIDKANIRILFENIRDKNEYLTRFYNLSMRVQPDYLHIIEPPMKNKQMNNNIMLQYKNVIRNMHYKGILQDTESGLEGVPTYMNVIKDLYVNYIIDYKILTPSALHYIEQGRLGSVFSSFYFRASIMNPYLVYSLNHSVLKGTKIFTPTLGWSSYCYGFLECPHVLEYVGTDVIPDVCKKTQEFASMYPTKKTKILCEPSENLAKSSTFRNKFREHFDVVFFSPPYYELELYPGKKQSTMMYKTYEEWLANYWLLTVKLCHHVLKKGGRMCYILSSYGCSGSAKCADNTVDILKDMNAITAQFFKKMAAIPMKNKNVHVTAEAHRETGERIMVYVK